MEIVKNAGPVPDQSSSTFRRVFQTYYFTIFFKYIFLFFILPADFELFINSLENKIEINHIIQNIQN